MGFEYQDGKLTKATHKHGYDLIEYNSEDLPNHITLYSQDGQIRGEEYFEYDSMNRLISFGNITLVSN